MPLTKPNMTKASRIMLPADAIFAAWVGAAWAFQADERTAIPSLYALRHIWPISATGVVLLVLAAAVTVGQLSHRRIVAAVALGGGFIAYLGLAFAIAWSLTNMPAASWSAPAWPLYIAVAHLASLVSLANDELTDDAGNHRRDA